MGQLAWSTQDPISTKVGDEDWHLRQFSDPHVYTVAHMHLHSHTRTLTHLTHTQTGQSYNGAIVNINCQIDRIWSHPGDKPVSDFIQSKFTEAGRSTLGMADPILLIKRRKALLLPACGCTACHQGFPNMTDNIALPSLSCIGCGILSQPHWSTNGKFCIRCIVLQAE